MPAGMGPIGYFDRKFSSNTSHAGQFGNSCRLPSKVYIAATILRKNASSPNRIPALLTTRLCGKPGIVCRRMGLPPHV